MNLSDLCIRRPVFAIMLLLVLIVVGHISYTKLRMDMFLNLAFPRVAVTTLRGEAEEIGTQISKPLKEVIKAVSGIDELHSTIESPDAHDRGRDAMGFFMYQPPEKGREFVQTGHLSAILLNLSVRESLSRFTDSNGNEIPNWLLVRCLDLGGHIVVIEPMEKLFIRLALGMHPWNSRGSQIVTLQELTTMRAE